MGRRCTRLRARGKVEVHARRKRGSISAAKRGFRCRCSYGFQAPLGTLRGDKPAFRGPTCAGKLVLNCHPERTFVSAKVSLRQTLSRASERSVLCSSRRLFWSNYPDVRGWARVRRDVFPRSMFAKREGDIQFDVVLRDIWLLAQRQYRDKRCRK